MSQNSLIDGNHKIAYVHPEFAKKEANRVKIKKNPKKSKFQKEFLTLKNATVEDQIFFTFVVFASVVILILLLLPYMILNGKAGFFDSESTKTNNSITQITKSNENKEKKISSLQAYANICQNAKAFGMTDTIKRETINNKF